jgi:hypothetical protein
MPQNPLKEAASLMGKRSYQARLKRLGIERIRQIARQNGTKGGRPALKGGKSQ